MKIVNVVGARPNLIKIASIIKEMNRCDEFNYILLHTGQHYDYDMSQVFFKDLSLPEPDIYLNVGSGNHATQTAKVMVEFEKFALDWQPDLVLVVGDVNSTLACAITSSKLNIPIAHVEAGLRSFDRTMPEEINRIVTDALSTFLFTTSRDANSNLRREGISEDKMFFVGNVMIDTLLAFREQALKSSILEQFNLIADSYLLLTLHRPSNVDDKNVFEGILRAIKEIQHDIPVLFPIHPRTTQRVQHFGLDNLVKTMPGLKITKPLGYLDFLHVMANARIVLTDSGGIQEETTILGVPCLTLRESTERPITVTCGTNRIIGTNPTRIVMETKHSLTSGQMTNGKIPELWDGKASQRITDIILKHQRLL